MSGARRLRTLPTVKPGVAPSVAAPDAGSATVWLLAVLFALLSLVSVAFTVTVISAVRQRAAGAADLAALAAAAMPPADQRTVCARADEVSAANGARLAACRVDGNAVEVTVLARLPAVLGPLPELSARARAGPWGGAEGVYFPVGVDDPVPERTPSRGWAAPLAASPPLSRRRRSATRATIRSPRWGWVMIWPEDAAVGTAAGIGAAAGRASGGAVRVRAPPVAASTDRGPPVAGAGGAAGAAGAERTSASISRARWRSIRWRRRSRARPCRKSCTPAATSTPVARPRTNRPQVSNESICPMIRTSV
ncbi:Rv3654c family TadE-like protein [Frankia sp. BMG5.23]|uniref:Rv3654c family TadE-like protein n=1 Tax=Frankia sp. BMG5.23 TaxID=683305 RepID=UPI001F23D566|nr:Rv3654c family TadE-like protein [Frankia sp. BMG5.23]